MRWELFLCCFQLFWEWIWMKEISAAANPNTKQLHSSKLPSPPLLPHEYLKKAKVTYSWQHPTTFKAHDWFRMTDRLDGYFFLINNWMMRVSARGQGGFWGVWMGWDTDCTLSKERVWLIKKVCFMFHVSDPGLIISSWFVSLSLPDWFCWDLNNVTLAAYKLDKAVGHSARSSFCVSPTDVWVSFALQCLFLGFVHWQILGLGKV